MKPILKIIIPIVSLAGFMSQLQAQSKIRGTVLNASGQPLHHANVLLLQSTDSALVKGVVSDSTGSYLFSNVPMGAYLLSFTYAGLQQVYTPPYFINSNAVDILAGETRLNETGNQLKNVTVTARKQLFEQKMDRLVINVRSSVTSAGATALDVLERSPGVVVDRQNNSISTGGKDGVVVMINGKESHMPISAVVQMLAGMTAGNIERIELITTPPANFTAEGNAGIINIVLIENNNDGTNGSFTNTIGVGKNQVASAALNFNHRKGKINFYGDYSYSITDMYQVFRSWRKIGFGGSIKEHQMVSYRDPVIKIFTGRMGMDIQLSKRTSVGAIVSGYTNNWAMKAVTHAWLSVDGQLDTIIHANIDELNHWKNFSANLNVYHVLGKDENLSVNLDYLFFRDRNPVNYLDDYFSGSNNFLYSREIKSSKLTPIRFWIGSTDYSRKLGKGTELQAGIKLTFSGFTNAILVSELVQNAWIADESFSANYELNENIQAGYISVNTSLGPKTSMKAGLRYEYTNSGLNTKANQKIVDRHYGKLFPGLFLSRKLNDNSAVNFSYSRRITRPTFTELAPFTIFLDPNSFTTGNPGLQPSIANVVTAGYSYKSYIFLLSYTHDAGAIARFQPKIDPATNKQFTSSENMKSLRTLALTISLPLNPAKWWSMQNNIIGKWQQSNSFYKDVAIVVDQKNFRITSMQSFRLPNNFIVEVSGYYHSAELIGRSVRNSFGTLDAGLQKKTGKNGKWSLTVSDILNTTNGSVNTNIPEQVFFAHRFFRFTWRMFKLTYTQGFGNNKLKGKRNRTESSEDERKRVE